MINNAIINKTVLCSFALEFVRAENPRTSLSDSDLSAVNSPFTLKGIRSMTDAIYDRAVDLMAQLDNNAYQGFAGMDDSRREAINAATKELAKALVAGYFMFGSREPKKKGGKPRALYTPANDELINVGYWLGLAQEKCADHPENIRAFFMNEFFMSAGRALSGKSAIVDLTPDYEAIEQAAKESRVAENKKRGEKAAETRQKNAEKKAKEAAEQAAKEAEQAKKDAESRAKIEALQNQVDRLQSETINTLEMFRLLEILGMDEARLNIVKAYTVAGNDEARAECFKQAEALKAEQAKPAAKKPTAKKATAKAAKTEA